MKVPAFPIPVEGELYSSVVARYLRRTAGYAKRNLGLIGLDKASAGAIAPMTIVKLTESMPERHPWSNNPREIVAKHTIIPLFLQSSNKEFYESTIKAISQGTNGNPSATLGLTKPNMISNIEHRHHSKFCPDCVSQDVDSLGFSVLYRQHQPDFVKYCARHCRPLRYSCINCSVLTRKIMWRMAGQCDCESPETPEVVDVRIDKITENSLIWIAQQVDYLLQGDASHTNLKDILRDLMESHELVTPNGKIRNSLLINAIESEIGSQLLHEFGFVLDLPPRRRARHDLSKVFRTNHNRNDIRFFLVVAKLFCDDIREIGDVRESRKLLDHKPKKTGKTKVYLSKQLIQDALLDAKGVVYNAAAIADLTSDKFRTTARHFQIALPLNEGQCNRIGSGVLQDVRKAMKKGMGLKEVSETFALSEHTTTLIFGDRPDLIQQGESNKKKIKVLHAKKKILAILKSQPQITRTELQEKHRTTMKLLDINHSTWIDSYVPKMPKGKFSAPYSLGREELQKKFRLAIQIAKDREVNKNQRPTRLTITRLRKDCAISWPRSQEFHNSKISKLLESACESKANFQERLIKWAVAEYAKLLIPISSNKLRRLAGLSIKDLLSCRQFVIKHAQAHDLSYHLRCSLSPFAKDD
jgi:hypothetical protein